MIGGDSSNPTSEGVALATGRRPDPGSGMTANELIAQYAGGRRDFRAVNLGQQDLFAATLAHSHPELFATDLSELVAARAPSAHRPLRGPNLPGIDMAGSILTDCDFRRSNLPQALFKGADARFIKLGRTDLSGADLSGADFRHANLDGCNLTGANLTESRFDHCSARATLFDRTHLWNTSFIGANLSGAQLINLDIASSDFSAARFNAASVSQSRWTQTRLRSAHLVGTRFTKVAFHDCDLSHASVRGALFTRTMLVETKMTNSTISQTSFERAYLSKVGLARAEIADTQIKNSLFKHVHLQNTRIHAPAMDRSDIVRPVLGRTSFTSTDLTPFIQSNPVHQGPTSVDYLSLVMTVRAHPFHPFDVDPIPELRRFLENSGMPSPSAVFLIDSIRSLDKRHFKALMQSTFISYGGPDEQFARQLNANLERNGVVTFFFPFDAAFGEKLHATMRRVDDYDRVILICSRQSLHRQGVQNEIEKVLEREAREGGASLLIPIAIDDYLFTDWQPTKTYLKQELLNRVVADFRNSGEYDSQFIRLLHALRIPDQRS